MIALRPLVEVEALVQGQIRGKKPRKRRKSKGVSGKNLEKTQDLIGELGLFCKKIVFAAAGGLERGFADGTD